MLISDNTIYIKPFQHSRVLHIQHHHHHPDPKVLTWYTLTLSSLAIHGLATMLTSLEMTIIRCLAGIGFLVAVFGRLLAFVSLLWIGARML